MKKIELLAPAKNLESGIAAVNMGADAVYIGAEKFGARAAAGNSVKDIEKLIAYAHVYNARVYAAVNTLLYDDELDEAGRLIKELYESGIDALIIQDTGILEMDIPPITIHASTQMNNFDIERIKFLDMVGIKRIILARELSLKEIRKIRNEVKCELEFFVHGALCVSLSGQCYMSASIGGRSGNRGDCAQPCRNVFDLQDASGKVILKGMHPLSLKDLNLSEHIKELIDSGIDSFKIEGRLKDGNYVKNITALYRRGIDSVLEGRTDLKRASSGKVYFDFTPDPERTFNRSYTEYFINGRKGSVGALNSPKSVGKRIGTVSEIGNSFFTVKSVEKINNGDGLFFYNKMKDISGIKANRVEGSKIFPHTMKGIFVGAEVFRNHDTAFEKILSSSKTERKISVTISFYERDNGFGISLQDEDGFIGLSEVNSAKEVSDSGTREDAIIKQVSRLGSTVFFPEEVIVESGSNYFIQASVLNELRRSAVEKLLEERKKNYRIESAYIKKEPMNYPFKKIDYTWNVVNKLAEKFYTRHGVEEIESGFEVLSDTSGKQVMTTAMCIKYELNLCTKFQDAEKKWDEPFFLTNERDRFRVEFDCAACMMKIFSE